MRASKCKQADYQERFTALVINQANQSTCDRRHVGALIVSSRGEILSMSSNGAIGGLPGCTDEHFSIGSGAVKNGCIHAEVKAIGAAAQEGLSTRDSSIYVTCAPCYACAHVIIASGITHVFYIDEYDKSGIELLEHANISVHRLQGTESSGITKRS